VDINEIRRSNLRFLVQEHAGGNLARFVDEKLQGQVSYKAIQRVTSPEATRNLGSTLARQIETQLHLEHGWMDQDHSGTAHTTAVPGGRSERIMQLAQAIEGLRPDRRVLVEQLVNELAEPAPKRRRKKK
jgi:hypothetical protein